MGKPKATKDITDNLFYVYEKLGSAVLSMMQSTESLQERLARACIYDLTRVSMGKAQLPTELLQQLEVITKSVTSVPGSGEGSILATTTRMSDEEASSLIEKILILYDDVAERIAGGLEG